MPEKNGKIRSTQNPPPVELSVKDLQQTKKNHSNKKKKLLQLQTSKPPRNSVKIRPKPISIHFKWALILTILCFFVIGPCWALYETYELRRLIARKKFEEANRLSNRISSVLVISTIIGVFAWVTFLFCSVGLLLTGTLLTKKFI